MTIESQVKKLDQLSRKLQELVVARRLKFVPPKLERRITKWFEKYLHKASFENPADLKFYLKALKNGYYFEITTSKATLKPARIIDITLPDPLLEQLPANTTVVESFEKDVLTPTGYQVVDWEFYPFEEVIDPPARILITVTARKFRHAPIDKPRFLYHITDVLFEKPILKRGLIPKDGPRDESILYRLKTYKSRVYLMAKSPKDWSSVLELLNPRYLKNEEFIIFRIDTNKFDRFNIFEDIEAEDKGFVWTPTHIPAKALKVVFRKTKDMKMSDFTKWTKRYKP